MRSGGKLTRLSHFNMTATAWRGLRRNWRLPLTARLLVQSLVAGPLFSTLRRTQTALTRSQRARASLGDSLFVLGYWRSGTTLLHQYLCCDKRFGYPSTYACLHPHHFILTQHTALAKPQTAIPRPMDDVRISASSPQEEEFAMLALGARSPYEALLAPQHLPDALALADPRDLCSADQARWRELFVEFLSGVAVVEAFRPLILKSPPHGQRVATLRELFPDARFVVIVRSPEAVFESAVRMWRSLFPIHALEPIPPEDHTRSAVLEDRPRFEAKLQAGLQGLPPQRLAFVRYEQLTRDPLETIGGVYEQLQLGGFGGVEEAIKDELRLRRPYVARNAMPPERWMKRLHAEWGPVFERYGYALPHG
jgi:omega-hydroxy-beta-dihydromenaquinone-9 sulfotransferase